MWTPDSWRVAWPAAAIGSTHRPDRNPVARRILPATRVPGHIGGPGGLTGPVVGE